MLKESLHYNNAFSLLKNYIYLKYNSCKSLQTIEDPHTKTKVIEGEEEENLFEKAVDKSKIQCKNTITYSRVCNNSGEW